MSLHALPFIQFYPLGILVRVGSQYSWLVFIMCSLRELGKMYDVEMGREDEKSIIYIQFYIQRVFFCVPVMSLLPL